MGGSDSNANAPSVPGPLLGDDLRRHLRDMHHFEVSHLRIAPDDGLVCEHAFHHADGLDIEEHTHG